jgi:hypothetical protein
MCILNLGTTKEWSASRSRRFNFGEKILEFIEQETERSPVLVRM